MNKFLKPIVKKLNNFKFTALLAAIGGVVSCLLIVLLFVCYSRSGTDPETGEVITAFVGTGSRRSINNVGMVFFLFCVVSLIAGIVIVYLSLPFIFPKEKLNPKKSIPWVLVGNAALHFALIIMVIFLLATEKSRMTAGFVCYIIFGSLFLIYSLLFIIPALKCNFFMPALVGKDGKPLK